jgi:AraC family transcriptional regulator
MISAMPRPATREDYAARILRVLVHLQERLADDLSLEDLARVAYFSPFHFHRVFRALVGESVKQHVRRLRLERAAQRLKQTRQPVIDIALDAGYDAHESFTRAFRGAFGVSPSAYRAKATLSDRISSPTGVHYAAGGGKPRFTPLTLEASAMDVELKTSGPIRIAFVRHVGPYDKVGPAWDRLMDWVGRECLFGPDVRFLGVCWDDPDVTPPDRLRYDACVTVDASIQPAADVGVRLLRGGRYAMTLHEGPYTRLNETYAALIGHWLPDHGYTPGDPPSLEFYLNDPNSTAPDDLLTEVWMPIEGDSR